MATACSQHQAYRALRHDILAVASHRPEGGWIAYIGTVRGECHDEEFRDVLQSGAQLEADVARAIFPEWADTRYAGE